MTKAALEKIRKLLTTSDKEKIAQHFDMSVGYIDMVLNKTRNNSAVVTMALEIAEKNKNAEAKQIERVKAL